MSKREVSSVKSDERLFVVSKRVNPFRIFLAPIARYDDLESACQGV